MLIDSIYMFDANRSKLDSVIGVVQTLGKDISVVSCQQDISGIESKINNVKCIITKRGIKVFHGSLIDSPNRAMKIASLPKFFRWRHDNVYEVVEDCMINDLIIAQTLLGGRYPASEASPMFECSGGEDVYAYFYTDASESDCRNIKPPVSPSDCAHAGSLIISWHRLRKLNQNTESISRERVDEFGEVFTPPNIVSDMLDLASEAYGEEGKSFPLDKTTLEPACGTGNFLVQMLERKLVHAHDEETVFMAVSTIYGIDIQKDNVLESRLRMLEIVERFCIEHGFYSNRFLEIIADILEKNIVGGDALKDRRGAMLHGSWAKGYVSNRTGLVEEDRASKAHGRLFFYHWEWHGIDDIRKRSDFLN